MHVGGGGAGVSTGAGPFTYYRGVGGGGSRRPHQTGPSAAQIAQAEKVQQAQLIAQQLQAIDNLHRRDFATPEKATAGLSDLPRFDRLLQAAEREHLKGVSWFDRTARREARQRARIAAEDYARCLLARARSEQAEAQAQIDEQWNALIGNEEHLVLAELERAFADNEAPVAAVGVDGDEVFLAVLVTGPEVLPDRMPGTTAAGNLSLRKMTKATRAAAYLSLVSGQVVVSAKEALARAPGIANVSIVALRAEGIDVFGSPRGVPLMATRLTRRGLSGVRWDSCSAWDVIAQVGSNTLVNPKGVARELAPLDLSRQPDLQQLVEATDLHELSDAARSRT